MPSGMMALLSGAVSPVALDLLVGQNGQREVEECASLQTLATAEAARNLKEQQLGRSYEDPHAV
jgi:hypothetical protein